MPPDYVGFADKWAHDEKQAVSYVCRNRPDKQGNCTTKKNASITILSVEQIDPEPQ
jgi:hypothetical protein|tara:strand:+ start:1101 stop:1268 length:168 start_codon:yes stop_codon:yes gene_type:complete